MLGVLVSRLTDDGLVLMSDVWAGLGMRLALESVCECVGEENTPSPFCGSLRLVCVCLLRRSLPCYLQVLSLDSNSFFLQCRITLQSDVSESSVVFGDKW